MGNYASVGASYTKQESDTKYPEKINVYSKTEDDEKFQLKGNYALKSDTIDGYTKQEVDDKFSLKGDYALKSELQTIDGYTKQEVDDKMKTMTIWCADGELCKLPINTNGIQIGNYKLKSDNNKLCVSDLENVTYCFDGKIVTKI
jgi:hypothetical protein